MRANDLEANVPATAAPAAARREDGDGGAAKALQAGERRGLSPAALLHLQRMAGNASVNALLDDEHLPRPTDVVGKGGGTPLDDDTRSEMEGHFGADFSNVRVHTDSQAAGSAKAVQASAYTAGSDIVFGEGQYSPGSEGGKRTLAHELTHVVQQSKGDVDGTEVAGGGFKVSSPDDRFEQAAEATADRVLSSDHSSGGQPVQREQLDAPAADEEPEPTVMGMWLQREGPLADDMETDETG